jgi:hypothetical protein
VGDGVWPRGKNKKITSAGFSGLLRWGWRSARWCWYKCLLGLRL